MFRRVDEVIWRSLNDYHRIVDQWEARSDGHFLLSDEIIGEDVNTRRHILKNLIQSQ